MTLGRYLLNLFLMSKDGWMEWQVGIGMEDNRKSKYQEGSGKE